jgi:hypothetical protein
MGAVARGITLEPELVDVAGLRAGRMKVDHVVTQPVPECASAYARGSPTPRAGIDSTMDTLVFVGVCYYAVAWQRVNRPRRDR